MTRVLYADDYRETKGLATILENEEIEVDCIDKGGRFDSSAREIFMEKYLPRIRQYDCLIVHLKDSFDEELRTLLLHSPGLRIVLISGTYKKRFKDRFLICDYDSEELVPFVKGEGNR